MLIKKERKKRQKSRWGFFKSRGRKTAAGVAGGVLVLCLIFFVLHLTGALMPSLAFLNSAVDRLTGLNVYHDIIAVVLSLESDPAALQSDPESITIDIGFEDYKKLEYKRAVALEEGILFSSDADYVPATIRYKDRTVEVKLRLKCDWVDQLEGDKWPFRIQVDGDDTLFGMNKFSIHKPEARGGVGEWLFHQTLKKEDFVALRYDFIDVTINGEHKGIYALEEHFDKLLIENSGYREGPILKFNGELVWADSLSNGQDVTDPVGLQSMYAADIDVFRENTITGDSVLYQEFIEGINLLEAFRNGELPTHQVFDVEKMAKFMALTDLLGAHHGLAWNNLRFYYNPLTSLLEPIGYDAMPTLLTFDNLLGLERKIGVGDEPFVFWDDNDAITKMIFYDPVFYQLYVQELERLSERSYLDGLFAELDGELRRNIAIIQMDNPTYVFSLETFYANQEVIKSALNPYKGVHAYFSHADGETVTLEVGNIQAMPVEVLNISYRGSLVFEPEQGGDVLQAKMPAEPVAYRNIEFVIPDGFIWDDECLADLELSYRIFGSSTVRTTGIFAWSHLSESLLAADFIRQPPNAADCDFLTVDDAAREIIVKSGDWEISSDVIIPAGYEMVCGGGTRLNLTGGATILSYSPLKFSGSETAPIIIDAPDATGQGLVVLNAGARSVMKNVVFRNLSAPAKGNWQMTGAVTFYESPVEFTGCWFQGNKTGDDMLNIVRSEFAITESLFRDTFFDALDVDFGQGTVSRSSFINCGNDALDVSGSVAAITDCTIRNTGDKGISAGEVSRVTVTGVTLEGCYLAIASKDMSRVEISNTRISQGEIGLAAYQKKPEFGPAEIEMTASTIEEVTQLYLCEEDSSIVIDHAAMKDDRQDLYLTLYGEE